MQAERATAHHQSARALLSKRNEASRRVIHENEGEE